MSKTIFSQTIATFKKTYARVAGITLISTVLSTIIGFAMIVGIFSFTPEEIGYNEIEVPDSVAKIENPDLVTELIAEEALDVEITMTFLHAPIPSISIIVIGTLLMLALAFITATATIAVLIRNKSLKESIKFSVPEGLRSIPTQMLSVALMVGGIASGSFALYAGFSSANTFVTILLILLGALTFLLTLILSVRLILVLFVWMEHQKETAWHIIKRSIQMTKGFWWTLVLLIVILLIVGTFANFVAATILSVAIPETLLSTEDIETLVEHIVVIFLLMPAMYAGLFTIYKSIPKAGRSNSKNT